MILQALNSYYHRLASDPDSGVPLEGTSRENISFVLVLSADGTLVDIEDLREQDGKKKRSKKMIVPAPVKRASGIKANFLWDTTGYVLGIDNKGRPERLRQCHQAFVEQVQAYCSDIDDPGITAVLKFLAGELGNTITSREDWPEISGANLVFRLDGVPGFIHDRPAAREAWQQCRADRGAATSRSVPD